MISHNKNLPDDDFEFIFVVPDGALLMAAIVADIIFCSSPSNACGLYFSRKTQNISFST